MSYRITVAALLSLLVVAPNAASAWEPLNSTAPTWGGPVSYALNQDGSADLPFATVESEVRRGMEDWTARSCTGLETTYEGVTADRAVSNDGQYIISWTESGWTGGGSTIGVTRTQFTTTSPYRILAADMEMNGQNYTWTTDPGSGSNVNIYSITLHEGGHYFGLGHSNSNSAAMYFAYSGGVSTITSDDEAGICALYPGSGGNAQDCNVNGCPSGQECVDGSCRPEGGTPPGTAGSTCDPCARHDDCGDSGDFCLGYATGDFCGTACTGASDCGANEQCRTLSGGIRQCVRYDGGSPSCENPTAPPPSGCDSDGDCGEGERCGSGGECVPEITGGAAAGEACGAHGDCASNACFAGTCAQTCDWPGGGCPDGTYCDGFASGACGAGVCMAGRAGAGANGDTCSDHIQCASLHCQAGRCAQPCIPGQLEACGGEEVCAVGELSCRGACGSAGSLGDPCEANGDCASGLCGSRNGHGFCTDVCTNDEGCGPGYRCSDEGAAAVCVPDGQALGEGCADNGDCASGICARESTRNYCTRLCDVTAPCAQQMACVQSGTEGLSVCQPQLTSTNDRPSTVSGCSVATDRGGSLPAALTMLALGLVFARRRGR